MMAGPVSRSFERHSKRRGVMLDSHKRASIVPVVHAVPGREATGEKEQRIVAFEGGLRTLPPRVCPIPRAVLHERNVAALSP